MTDEIEFLALLEGVIAQRINDASENSYTARLVAGGRNRVAQKVGEEALELALAATADNRVEQLDEAADLVFHLLVLLNTLGLSIADVSRKLQERHEAAK